jgi:hypothetical protein
VPPNQNPERIKTLQPDKIGENDPCISLPILPFDVKTIARKRHIIPLGLLRNWVESRRNLLPRWSLRHPYLARLSRLHWNDAGLQRSLIEQSCDVEIIMRACL